MKKNLTDNLQLILVIIAIFAAFGLSMPKAITEDRYNLDNEKLSNKILELERKITHLEESLHIKIIEVDCYSTTTRQLFLRIERVKYSNSHNIKIEEGDFDALAAYERAIISLNTVTNHMSDVERKLSKINC